MSKKSISFKIRRATEEINYLKYELQGYYINMKAHRKMLRKEIFNCLVLDIKAKEKKIKLLRGKIAELNRKNAKS